MNVTEAQIGIDDGFSPLIPEVDLQKKRDVKMTEKALTCFIIPPLWHAFKPEGDIKQLLIKELNTDHKGEQAYLIDDTYGG